MTTRQQVLRAKAPESWQEFKGQWFKCQGSRPALCGLIHQLPGSLIKRNAWSQQDQKEYGGQMNGAWHDQLNFFIDLIQGMNVCVNESLKYARRPAPIDLKEQSLEKYVYQVLVCRLMTVGALQSFSAFYDINPETWAKIFNFLGNPSHHTHLQPYNRSLGDLLLRVFQIVETPWEEARLVSIQDNHFRIEAFEKYHQIFVENEMLIWLGLAASGNAMALAQTGKVKALNAIEALLAISDIPDRYEDPIFVTDSYLHAAQQAAVARLWLKKVSSQAVRS